MTNDKLEAIRRRDQSPYMASTAWLSQSEEDRRALLAAYDALRSRLAEARANAFQDALDCMRDRQARDHLAACLQDKYGVWWKTDSADKDQFWSGLQAEIDAQWPEQPTSDKRQISPEANTDSADVAPKRCKACNETGLIHCQHPDECGGPWDKHNDSASVEGEKC